jgi:hypothetical protein
LEKYLCNIHVTRAPGFGLFKEAGASRVRGASALEMLNQAQPAKTVSKVLMLSAEYTFTYGTFSIDGIAKMVLEQASISLQ